MKKLGIHIDGDEQDKADELSPETAKKRACGMAVMERHVKKDLRGEPLLNWRNRCGNRTSAMSVVGTSQYMAPEVIEGKRYDARCDWWSVGVILFECIYGHTPFLSEEGRQQTKINILKHHEMFGFPMRPTVSHRCQHLMASLITDKEQRLCSKRYRMKDYMSSTAASSSCLMNSSPYPHPRGGRDFAGRYVFPYDAEDIKAHKWFRNIPWERLHELDPPLVPKLSSADDTRYFDDDGSSVSEEAESAVEEEEKEGAPPCDDDPGPKQAAAELVCHYRNLNLEPGWRPPHQYPPGFHLPTGFTMTNPIIIPPPLPIPRQPTVEVQLPIEPFPPAPSANPSPSPEQLAFLHPLRRTLQEIALAAISTPLDPDRAHVLEQYIGNLPGTTPAEREHMREFVRRFGVRREAPGRDRKRPRDRLLRDKRTKGVAMEVRRRTAFLGYEWRRMGREYDDDGGLFGGLDGEGGEGGIGVGDGDGVGAGEGLEGEGEGGDGNDGHWEERYTNPDPYGVNSYPLSRCLGGFQGREGDVAAMRALHRGPWGMR